MKYTSALVVMALLGAVSARHHHHHHRHMQPRSNLIGINHADEWDPNTMTAFMNAKEYMGEVRNAIEDDEEKPQPKKGSKMHGIGLNQKVVEKPKKVEVVKPPVQIQNKSEVKKPQ